MSDAITRLPNNSRNLPIQQLSLNQAINKQIQEFERWTCQQKSEQRIFDAYNSNSIAGRSISLYQETKYLLQTKKQPRPVTWIHKDIPTDFFGNYLKILIEMEESRDFLFFKENAGTSDLLDGSSLNELDTKLIPSYKDFYEKRQEMEQFHWDPHVQHTSGHIKADGTFSLPKRKYIQNNYPIQHSEILIPGYNKEQILGVLLTKKDEESISRVIKYKKMLEDRLGIKTLPVTLYNETNGNLEVISTNNLTENDIEKIGNSEKALNRQNSTTMMNPRKAKEIMNMLPLKDRIDLLKQLEHKSYVYDKQLVDKAVTIVSNPDNYNVEQLRSLITQGLDINIKIQHNKNYKTMLHLIEIFLKTEQSRYQKISSNHQFLESSNNKQHSEKGLALFKELMNHKFCISLYMKKMIVSLGAKQPEYLELALIAGISLLDEFGNVGYDTFKNHIFSSTTNYATVFLLDQYLTTNASEGEIMSLIINTRIPWWHDNDQIKEDFKTRACILSNYVTDISSAIKNYNITNSIKYYKDRYPDHYMAVYGDKNTDEIKEEVIKFIYDCKKNGKECIDWQTMVKEAKVKLENNRLLATKPKYSEQLAIARKNIELITNAFKKPTVFNQVNNDDITVAKILNENYRRPGYQRIPEVLASDNEATEIWKPLHTCVHPMRTYIYMQLATELLEKFTDVTLSKNEKDLLQLAIVYHDAAAEDVSKQDEELESANRFKQSMKGHFSDELISKIALALESKEDDVHKKSIDHLPDDVRLYVSLLRFSDRLDFIRFTGVDADFPNWNNTNKQYGGKIFNPAMLDFPEFVIAKFNLSEANQKSFLLYLSAVMNGCADLVAVTENEFKDTRDNNYSSKHKLAPENNIKQRFENTSKPITKIMEFVDDNYRREIAYRAEHFPCNDAQHETCKADVKTGITRGYHSTSDLRKHVGFSENTTLLDKLAAAHNLDLVSELAQQDSENTITNLQINGSKLNTGTNTQDILASEVARQYIEKEEGVKVEKQQYFRGYDKAGKPIFDELWKKISVKDIELSD